MARAGKLAGLVLQGRELQSSALYQPFLFPPVRQNEEDEQGSSNVRQKSTEKHTSKWFS